MTAGGIRGTWKGKMSYRGASQRCTLEVDESDGLSARFDLPDAGFLGRPTDQIEVNGSDVTFDLPFSRGRLEGVLYDDRIVGNTGSGYHAEFEVEVELERSVPTVRPFNEHEITFAHDAVSLEGTLSVPDGDGPHPAVVIAHSSGGGSRDEPYYRFHADWFAKSNIATLRFDRRGSGASTGKFETADFGDLADDLLAGVGRLRHHNDIDSTRIGVWGHSQGGWIGPEAASRSTDIAFCVIVSGAAVSPAEQMNFYTRQQLEKRGYDEGAIEEAIALRTMVDEYFRGKTSKKRLLAAIDEAADEPWCTTSRDDIPNEITGTKWYNEFDYNPVPALEAVDQPTLVVCGGSDGMMPNEDSIPVWKSTLGGQSESWIHQIPNADHYLTVVSRPGEPWQWRSLATEYTDILGEWLREYEIVAGDG